MVSHSHRIRLKETRRETVINLISVPIDVRDRFKAWCARRGITMTQKLISLMKDVVDKAPESQDDPLPKQNPKRPRKTTKAAHRQQKKG